MLLSEFGTQENNKIKEKVQEIFQKGESKWRNESTFLEKKAGLYLILQGLQIMKNIVIRRETDQKIVKELHKQFKMRQEDATQKLEFLEKLHKSENNLGIHKDKLCCDRQQEYEILNKVREVDFDDIFGIQQAKNALKESVLLPMKFPQFFERYGIPWKGILIFGPPGTGKTLIAEACATRSQATFFSISCQQLICQFQGGIDQKIKQLFSLAKEKKFTIIFIDDFDKLYYFQDNDQKQISRKAINEYLIQMEKIKFDKSGGIFVIGATNQPWVLETSVRRTFEIRIYIPLPDILAREDMIQNLLRNTKTTLTKEEFKDLAVSTDGYSGSDISILVRDAVNESVKKLQQAKKFRKIIADGQQQLDVNEEQTPTQLTQNDILIPDVCYKDFLIVLQQFQKSVSKEMVEKYENWVNEFGKGK